MSQTKPVEWDYILFLMICVAFIFKSLNSLKGVNPFLKIANSQQRPELDIWLYDYLTYQSRQDACSNTQLNLNIIAGGGLPGRSLVSLQSQKGILILFYVMSKNGEKIHGFRTNTVLSRSHMVIWHPFLAPFLTSETSSIFFSLACSLAPLCWTSTTYPSDRSLAMLSQTKPLAKLPSRFFSSISKTHFNSRCSFMYVLITFPMSLPQCSLFTGIPCIFLLATTSSISLSVK